MNTAVDQADTIARLNSLLRNELAAVESYRRALEQLNSTLYHSTLLECCRSHEDRAEVLREEILARGGEPVNAAEAWQRLSRFAKSGNALLGDDAAIFALADGENDGQDDYRFALEQLDLDARQLVESSILPEQQRMLHAVSDIKRLLAA